MPDHVVPKDFMIHILLPVRGKQSSVITIFALWNTMMGTSLLSMPWAILQAGFACGIALLVFMALIMFYTSYLVLKSTKLAPGKQFNDFSDVCAHFLGKHSRKLAVGSSLATLFGGCIVYWILLSNFLYHIVVFIKNEVDPIPSTNHTNSSFLNMYSSSAYLDSSSNSSDLYPDAVCSLNDNSTEAAHGAFEKFWTLDLSVPLILAVPLFALVNFKSATIFTKVNSFGVLSVVFLYIFTIVKAVGWGVHLDLGTATQSPTDDPSYAAVFEWTFPALTGVSALAYFVQNCVITITRNQKHPEHNIRDLAIAYCLVAVSYIFFGVLVYMMFPLAKSCIKDNFLNNIAPDDVLAFVAHIMLLMQMTCVFPLLTYILRAQVLTDLFGSEWPSWKHVVILNLVVFAVCIVFAIFLPHIGRIIGFVGAFCGLAYAIALPCIVHMRVQYLNEKLTWTSLILHSLLILLGSANFISQFVIIGKTS
ncbi:hypothetical protein V1264_023183 [Littorina saxatilis]|uniref:Amino acid transporter transmembrane domain-containing protein n=2 Tax=Littorina saxatilis TaxID=31220 RepID=A0AAN9B6Q3_9CAEN